MSSKARRISALAVVLTLFLSPTFFSTAWAEPGTAGETTTTASTGQPAQAANPIQVSSLEDLKPYLSIGEVVLNGDNAYNKTKVLALSSGSYQLASDLQIDLTDPYFADKQDAIRNGLFSHMPADPSASEANFTFDGKGHTITVSGDNAFSLFGTLRGNEITLTDLNVTYTKNVLGHGLAQEIIAGGSTSGLSTAYGKVNKVSVTIPGEVVPTQLNRPNSYSNHFTNGRFDGDMATGFAWFLQRVNIDDLTVKVSGNIGSTTPPAQGEMSGAFGLTFHYSNANVVSNGDTWKEIFVNGNPAVLEQAGHVKNLNITVAGNIQAYGHYRAYATGIGFDMGTAWIDNANVTVTGDIAAVTDGQGGSIRYNVSQSLASGVSEEVQNFTNSKVNVGRLVFNAADNIPLEAFGRPVCGGVFGIGEDNSKGYYQRVKNNAITINEIKAKAPHCLNMTPGFMNSWNTHGSEGVYTQQENSDNTITVGPVDVSVTNGGQLIFFGLGMKTTTGTTMTGTFTPPEVSLQNNKLSVGNLTLNNPKGNTTVALVQHNAANAKGNNVDYANISITGKYLDFAGLGNLSNKEPAVAGRQTMAENNHIRLGDLSVNVADTTYISLLAGLQQKGQQMRNNTVQAGKTDIKISAGTRNWFISGIVAWQVDNVSDCHVYTESINVDSTSSRPGYFGGSVAYGKDTSITDSSVFVHDSVALQTKNPVWGGGFAGYTNTMTFERNNLQIDGDFNPATAGGRTGGFSGQSKNSTFANNSALMLNSFAPFANYMSGGTMTDNAHYINKPAPEFWSGMLASGDTNNLPVVKNSTLLVENENKDTVLLPTDYVDINQSTGNWVTVVDNQTTPLDENTAPNKDNRKAFATKTSTITWGGDELPVLIRDQAKPAGSINIALRPFQDAYWNPAAAPYRPAVDGPEAKFTYLDNKTGVTELTTFGVDAAKIVPNRVEEATLTSWHNRHLGLKAVDPASGTGPVFDLLGIRAAAKYVVTYDRNGATAGDVPTDNNFYLTNDPVTVAPLGNLTRDGHKFIGWATTAQGAGTIYQPGDSFAIETDTVLYARWEQIPAQPETPGTPGRPDQPGKPDTPGKPGEPKQPGKAPTKLPKTGI